MSYPSPHSDVGSVVRPFAIVAGRTRPSRGEFDLVSVIYTRPQGKGATTRSPEESTILALCQVQPMSVAEIAAGLGLPVGVIRVLLGDLLNDGRIRVTHPASAVWLTDQNILKEVADALRAL
ncbi:DUF742 domain-containing protein [Streptomyces sp. NBC_00648]|uniref:DUF742 domain-containing protein n=1 Tax=Streptomyces sp. NBC_00648 TaxID=2975797 RepID=UPI003245A7CB